MDHRTAHVVAGLELDHAIPRIMGNTELEAPAAVAPGRELVVQRDVLVGLLGPALDDQNPGQDLGAADADMRPRRRRAAGNDASRARYRDVN
jgi:hypothetical protein